MRNRVKCCGFLVTVLGMVCAPPQDAGDRPEDKENLDDICRVSFGGFVFSYLCEIKTF